MSTTGRNVAQSESIGKKVIIVGAGLAGLCCAYELSKLGYKINVLEANSCPGGRVQTLRRQFSDSQLFGEAGPYWISEAHTVVMRYFTELRILHELIEVPVQGDYLLYNLKGQTMKARLSPNVTWADSLHLDTREKEKGLGWAMATILSNPDVGNPAAFRWPSTQVVDKYGEMTFEQFLALHHPAVDGPYKPSDGATAFMSRWFAWWDDPGKLSALAMIQYGVLGQRLCDDPMVAPKWFVSNSGMDIFPQAFEQRIIEIIRQQRAASGGSEEASATNPFLYNARVIRIEQKDRSVTAEYVSPSGDEVEIEADYLVCAIPFSTLREVQVVPCFSEEKKKAINELRYARVARIYLECKKQFTDLANGAGFTDLPIGNLLDMTFVQGKRRGILLQAFVAGKEAKTLSEKNEHERKQFLLPYLQTVFTGIQERDIERWIYKFWDSQDPYVRGAYPLFTPETFLWLRRGIMTAPEGRVHFAGEHTSEYTAWMEGALRSGMRVAKEISLRTMAEH